MDRRTFVQALGVAASAMAGGRHSARGQPLPPSTQPAGRDRFGEWLPTRPLGKSGVPVTILCLGGSHHSRLPIAEAERAIEAAIELGVRFFDSAESYGGGESEERYGRFLTPNYRDVAFIMTKTRSRNAKIAREHLDGSLRRMKTDYIDLWQIHELCDAADTDDRLNNGVLDVVLKAKEQGKVRHLGFTGHRSPQALLRMLERAGEFGDPFTACQMPINVADPSYSSYLTQVVTVAVKQNLGVLAMKTVAHGQFFGRDSSWTGTPPPPTLIPEVMSLAEALGFVWNQPIASLVSGIDNVRQLRQNAEIARHYRPMNAAEQAELIRRVARFAGPNFEFYKA